MLEMGCVFLLIVGLNPLFSRKNYRIYLGLITLLMTILAYNIEVYDTMDLFRHYQNMDLYREEGLKWVLENRMDTNPLTALFLYAFSCLNNNRLMPAAVTFISFSCMFEVIYKAGNRFGASKSRLNFVVLFLICNYNYFLLVSCIRIWLGYAILVLLLYMDIVERKYRIVSWTGYILLCFFHYALTSVLLMRVLLVFARCKFFKKYWKIWILLVPSILVVGVKLLPYMINFSLFRTILIEAEGYEQYSTFGIWQFCFCILRLITCLGMCIYIERRKNRFEDGIVWLSRFILFNIIFVIVMFSNFQIVYRTPDFLIPLTCVLVFGLQKTKFAHQLRQLVLCESLIHIFYLFIYVYPYMNFQI